MDFIRKHARQIRRGLLRVSVGLYKIETALRALTKVLISISRLEFFRNREGRKVPLKLFIEQPSRRFLLPELSQLEKVYLILTSMHYEVVEQSIEPSGFHLVAAREQRKSEKTGIAQSFKEVSILITGVQLENHRWQVTVLFRTTETLTVDRAKYADLLLENITLAFGWQNFWIIECPPPQSLAA